MNGFLGTIELIYDLYLFVLGHAILAGIAASFLAVLVLTFNRLFRRWLTAGQMSWLWGIVLLRLVIPFGPGSHLSLQNAYISITELKATNVESEVGSQPYNISQNADRPVRRLATAESMVPWKSTDLQQTASGPVHAFVPADFDQTEPHPFLLLLRDLLELSIPFAWLTGFVLIPFWTLFSHFRFTRRVNQAPQCQDVRVLNLWSAACRQAGLSSEIPVVIFDEIHQPAVMGVLRPHLLLPSETLSISDRQLTMVMLHEAAHLKCWDLAVNWALLLVRAVHWWNPIYWIAATRYVNLREQARDAMVLRWTNNSSEQEYSKLLLMFAEQKSVSRWRVVLPAAMVGFLPSFFRKRAIANRLRAVKTAGNSQHWLQIGLVSCAIALIAFAGLTDAKTPKPVDPGIQWLSQQALSGKVGFVSTNDSSPFTLRIYDLSGAILKVAELEQIPKAEASRKIEVLVKQMASFPKQAPPLNSDVEEQPSPQIEIARQGQQTSVITNGRQSLHAQLEHMLQAWAKSGLGQIKVETRIMTSKRDAAAMAGLEWSSILMTGGDSSFTSRTDQPHAGENQPTVSATAVIEESVPFMTQILSDTDVLKLIQAAQGDARANIMFAPKVTLFNGQHAEIFSTVFRPYVVGIELDEDGNKKPKINIIDEGMSLAMTPTLSENLQGIQMQTQLGLSEVTDVSTFTYKLKGEDVTVKLPTVRRHKFQVGASIKTGQTLVIACPPTNGRKEFFYLLLTPTSSDE